MEITPRKIKIFNRILQEFIKEYNEVADESKKIPSFKIKDVNIMKTFKEEVEFTIEDFKKCDGNSFDRITLCKKFNLTQEDSSASLWKYLHLLYLTLLPEKNQELVECFSKGVEELESLGTVTLSPKGDLNNLISQISQKISGQMGGVSMDNIDPMELMNKLMQGDNLEDVKIGNLNFNDILKETSDIIQEKVNKGEINLENLKNETMHLLNNGGYK